MFNKNKTTTNPSKGTNDVFSANTIQNGTVIEGKVISEGSIRIDGKLIGSIVTKAKIVIGKTGVIEGDITCKDASVEGKVNGTIQVQNLLDLKSTGFIRGDINTNKLVVEPGAKFNGKCTMNDVQKSVNVSPRRRAV
jgi:cytoskeletal protein CcmA (bactofilin family)